MTQRYHDEEWGRLNHSDKVHFEFLYYFHESLCGVYGGLDLHEVANDARVFAQSHLILFSHMSDLGPVVVTEC